MGQNGAPSLIVPDSLIQLCPPVAHFSSGEISALAVVRKELTQPVWLNQALAFAVLPVTEADDFGVYTRINRLASPPVRAALHKGRPADDVCGPGFMAEMPRFSRRGLQPAAYVHVTSPCTGLRP